MTPAAGKSSRPAVGFELLSKSWGMTYSFSVTTR
jgi:hypothetical protein